MIVRINALDSAIAEVEAGWATAGLLGPLPVSTGFDAFELAILAQDEMGRDLPLSFRQAQFRRMIPHALAALAAADEQIVLRLDGPIAEGELLSAYRWLTEPDGQGRFAISGVTKLDDHPMDTIASVRIHPSPSRLLGLCGDIGIGLERSVRLRAFCVSEAYVPMLLDLAGTEDSRWDQLLPEVGVMIGTGYGLRSLQVFSRRHQANEIRLRIMQKLIAAAATSENVPAGT